VTPIPSKSCMHTFRIISYPPEVPMYFFGAWWGKVLFRGTPDPASAKSPADLPQLCTSSLSNARDISDKFFCRCKSHEATVSIRF
jgi:hypothetical protein